MTTYTDRQKACNTEFAEFHEAAVKLVSDMLDQWAAGTRPIEYPDIQARVNALLTSPKPGQNADSKNQVALDRNDLFVFIRGLIHDALNDGIPPNSVGSWAWQEATDRTFKFFRDHVDDDHLESTSPITGFSEPDGGADVRSEPIYQRRKAGLLAWHDCTYEQFVEVKGRIDWSTRALYPAPSQPAAPAEEVSPIVAPYSNCSFRICDLPGQCAGEGKCHHPATAAYAGAAIDVLKSLFHGAQINNFDSWSVEARALLAAAPVAAPGATLTDEQWHNAVNAALAEDPDNGLLQSAVDWVQKTCDERDVYGVAYRALQHYFAMHKKLPPSDNYAAPTPVADSGASEGWKTLPPKLTPEMKVAMVKAAREYLERTGGNSPEAMYEAAFAAAIPMWPQMLTDERISEHFQTHAIYSLEGKKMYWAEALSFARAILAAATGESK